MSFKLTRVMVFSAKVDGSFRSLWFPIQQFNEKGKDQTGNPRQQPRNPRFVMLIMQHCKHTQTANRRSKQRGDL